MHRNGKNCLQIYSTNGHQYSEQFSKQREEEEEEEKEEKEEGGEVEEEEEKKDEGGEVEEEEVEEEEVVKMVTCWNLHIHIKQNLFRIRSTEISIDNFDSKWTRWLRQRSVQLDESSIISWQCSRLWHLLERRR